MSTNKTDFLNMNDWVGTDQFRREELNANFRALDAKAKEHNDHIGDLTTLGTTEKGNLVKAVNEVTTSLAEIASINNNSVIPTYTNGQLTKVEEKEGSVVKASSTLTYNSDGTVNTVTELINGETVVTTLNYTNGEFSSISRAVV